MATTDRVLIMGAGMGGLALALELERTDSDVLIVERDDEPPDIPAASASEAWDRPGVPQFRMAHSLLARLHTILRTRHPAVLRELAEAGVEPCPVRFVLPENQIEHHTPQPDDVELLHILGRRATFEYVLRKYVAKLPRVRFVHGTRIEGLEIEQAAAHLRVRGVQVARGDKRETITADVVVDATGSRTKSPEWLRARGAAVETEVQRSDFQYFCRDYRMRDGGAEPFQRRTGAALDYLWYGAFFAEHGHFALAVACPEAEAQLGAAIKSAQGFDRLTRGLPGVASLLDRADPIGKVLGAGDLKNSWTHYSVKGKPEVLGFFAVGDSHVTTNPMYGRGCTTAFVQAQALAEVLRAERDPVQRARKYAARVWQLLRPQYEFAAAGDRLFAARGRRARGEAMPRSELVADYVTDQIWAPAAVRNHFIARESVKTIQMQPEAPFWTRIEILAWMFFYWTLRGFRRVPLVSERSGPSREELLRELGIAEGAAAQNAAVIAPSVITRHG